MLDPHEALGLLSNPTPQWGLCGSQSARRLQVHVWSALSVLPLDVSQHSRQHHGGRHGRM